MNGLPYDALKPRHEDRLVAYMLDDFWWHRDCFGPDLVTDDDLETVQGCFEVPDHATCHACHGRILGNNEPPTSGRDMGGSRETNACASGSPQDSGTLLTEQERAHVLDCLRDQQVFLLYYAMGGLCGICGQAIERPTNARDVEGTLVHAGDCAVAALFALMQPHGNALTVE